jgi:hypothetical protein
VIEITDDESDAPPPKQKDKRPPQRPTKPMPASVPVSGEVIEISSDEGSLTFRNRSKSKSKSKSRNESKVPSTKPSRVDDGPPSTLRINTGKSKSVNKSQPSRPMHKARHSLSGRVDGKGLQKELEQEIIVIDDSDDEEQSKAMPVTSASTRTSGGVRSAPPRRAPVPWSMSPPTMDYGDEDQVMRDPSPDRDPVPQPRTRTRPEAGGSMSSTSISTSKQEVRSQVVSAPVPDMDKPVQDVTKSSDTHRQAIPAAVIATSSTSNAATAENAKAGSSKSIAPAGQATSAKATSNNPKSDANAKADMESTASVARDRAVDTRVSEQATSGKGSGNDLGTNAKVGLGAMVSPGTAQSSQSRPVPPTQTAVLSKKDGGLAVPVYRDQDAVSVPVPAKTTVPAKVVAKAAAPARGDDAMDVDRNAASMSKNIPLSSKPGDTAAAKTPSGQVDVNNSSMGTDTRAQIDSAVQIHTPLARMPAAISSQRSTQPPPPASSSSISRQARNDKPLSWLPTGNQEASSSSGSASTSASSGKTYSSFWSSNVWSSAGNKAASSSQRETGRNQQDQEKIPTNRQSSGMDMRTLKEVLTKEVPVDKAASSAGSALSSTPLSAAAKPAPAAPGSTSPLAPRVTPAPGPGPTAGPSLSAVSIAATQTNHTTSVSNTAVAPAPVSQRPSTPATATATTVPVPQLPPQSTPAPIPLQRDLTPASASNMSPLPRRILRQFSASSVSEVQPRVPSPPVCMLHLPAGFWGLISDLRF